MIKCILNVESESLLTLTKRRKSAEYSLPLRDTTCGRATFHLNSEEVYKDIAHTRNTEYTWSYVVVSDLN